MGLFFLYSFLVCSLLGYRKATGFCKLVFYTATLLKVFMVGRSFLMEFSRSFRCNIMSSANRDSFTSSFSI
jgi:hypothetical protein